MTLGNKLIAQCGDNAHHLYQLYCIDALEGLREIEDNSIHCAVTSPPYCGMRKYIDNPHEIGHEPTVERYIENLVTIFRELRRVLRMDGTFWLNIGDCYVRGKWGRADHERLNSVRGGKKSGNYDPGPKQNRTLKSETMTLKNKDLALIPALLSLALREDGWIVRQKFTWHKTNAYPVPFKDRSAPATEEVFLFSKSPKYWFNRDALPVHNVWQIGVGGDTYPHPAKFPQKLADNCVLAGCSPGGIVLDPFCGSAVAGAAAIESGRKFIGFDLNPEFLKVAEQRLQACRPPLETTRTEHLNGLGETILWD